MKAGFEPHPVLISASGNGVFLHLAEKRYVAF